MVFVNQTTIRLTNTSLLINLNIMKRIFTCLFVLSCFSYGHSQITKGSLLLGGEFSATTAVGQTPGDFSTALAPSAGLFLSDRFALGTGLGLDFFTIGDDLSGGTVSISPFARYYLSNRPDNPLKWFVHGGAGLAFGLGDNSDDPVYSLNVGTGLNYFLNDQIALEGSLLYADPNLENSGRNSNLSLRIGLQLFLHPKSGEGLEDWSVQKAGKLLLGGSFTSFGTTVDSELDQRSFVFRPRVGWFVSEKWAIGSGLMFNYSSSPFYEGYGVGLAPFVRFYPQNTPSNLQWFLTAKAGFQYVSNQFDDSVTGSPDFDNKGWLKTFKAGVGLNWFLSENLALEGIFSYDYLETVTLPEIRRSLGFELGFQFFINR